ncbi:transcriptional activator of glycolytic enzymes-domain-containing protein [Thamnocephalis sphaerospora]|uniref:Transcriptional activator of glycolytic enzymes-domain-containing protein n=1 Tax=Thamnocephalis sphaerospora TaxID=78915 RepID=A0A4P9XLU5_9FUNG|nr:transcriptional activator of glycolytic enzymes-domain-containing protein [Thamnocephalis sphaerospora]|eukprot:RKP06796.1 transcriptional activator of glycolytic enzymes-domain-containing protein [Thamnocephalis sphaerospora]
MSTASPTAAEMVDSIIADLHSAAVATGTDPNPVSAIDLLQQGDHTIDLTVNGRSMVNVARAADDGEEGDDGDDGVAEQVVLVTKDAKDHGNDADEFGMPGDGDHTESVTVDMAETLIEREPGSQMVVRFDYDDVVRRALLPSDITLDAFKLVIERKTSRQFDRLMYFHRGVPVDVFDEDDFHLAVSSTHEPHFFLRQQGEPAPLSAGYARAAPPDHSGLLGDAPGASLGASDLLSAKRNAADAFGDDRAECMPRSLAARMAHPCTPPNSGGSGGFNLASPLALSRRSQSAKKRLMSNSQMLSFYELRTVRRLWKEYTEGIDGRPSIRALDEEHGPVWRRDHYQSYQRRMRIVKEIQRRAAEVGIDSAIEELEQYGSLHKVTEALRERHVQSPEGRQRRERVLKGMRRRRLRLEAEATARANGLPPPDFTDLEVDELHEGRDDDDDDDAALMAAETRAARRDIDMDPEAASFASPVGHLDDEEEERS